MKRSTRARILFSSATLAAALGLAPGLVMAAAAMSAGRPLQSSIALGAIGLTCALGLWIAWLARAVGPSRRRLRDPWYQAKLAQFAIQSAKRGT